MPGEIQKGSISRYFARVVRALIVSSLGFGGGIGLLTFIAIIVNTGRQDALSIALQAGVVIGIGFGIVCAAVLLLSDLSSRLAVADGAYSEIWELEQKRIIQVKGTVRDARTLARNALQAVPNVKAVADEDDEMRIRASVGPTWKSPGEQLHVVITQDSEDLWSVACTSSCLSSNIAFDYGKNFENVESWAKSMRALMAEGAQAISGAGIVET